MNDDEELSVLLGDADNLRMMIEWQQNQYHQLQNRSQALLSSLIAVVAIVATLWTATNQVSLKTLPTSVDIDSVARESILGSVGLSSIFLFNYIISYLLLALVVIIAIGAVYKLYDIIASPRLQPQLKNTIFLQSSDGVKSEDSRSFGNSIQPELMQAFTSNRQSVETAQRNFKRALIRIPAAAAAGFFGLHFYFQVQGLQIWGVIFGNIMLIMPASISAKITSRIVSSEAGESPNSFGNAILQPDGGRFPNDLNKFEIWCIVLISLLSAASILVVMLEILYTILTVLI